GEIWELHQGRLSWCDGLDETLVDVDRGKSWEHIAVGESNSIEGLVQRNGFGTDFKFDYCNISIELKQYIRGGAYRFQVYHTSQFCTSMPTTKQEPFVSNHPNCSRTQGIVNR